MFGQFLPGQGRLAGSAIEHRNRYAPGSLARDTPVGAIFNHIRDAFLAPWGDPLHPTDFVQGALPQVIGIHGNEPLPYRER